MKTPGGARVTDDRLWTLHPILHRLRRLHFGLGILLIAMSVEVSIGRMTVAVALAVAMLVAFSLSWMTTYLPEARWVWVVTSLLPVLSLGALLAAILSIWMPGSGLRLEELHTMTFGVALILGLAALLSLFAGPLSVGALVFATFIGVTMGAAAGLFVDAVLGTDILRSAGVGWVSVATLLFLATLLVVALVLTLVGRIAEEHGATRPLPREFGRWRRMVLRRIELETRILFYAAAFLGLAVFLAVGFIAYRHGLQLRDTEGAALFAFWGTLVAGLEVGALPPFPQGARGVLDLLCGLANGLFRVQEYPKRVGRWQGRGGPSPSGGDPLGRGLVLAEVVSPARTAGLWPTVSTGPGSCHPGPADRIRPGRTLSGFFDHRGRLAPNQVEDRLHHLRISARDPLSTDVSQRGHPKSGRRCSRAVSGMDQPLA